MAKSLMTIVQTGSFQSAAQTLGTTLLKLQEQDGVTLVYRTEAAVIPPHALWPSCPTPLLYCRLPCGHWTRCTVGDSALERASTSALTLLQPYLRSYLGTDVEGEEVHLRIAASPNIVDQLPATSYQRSRWTQR